MIYIGELLKENINEYKKLKKYSIYLDMKEQLERVKDSRLYQGVNQSKPLTINTIDIYSYKEVKRVLKNIKTIEKDLFK